MADPRVWWLAVSSLLAAACARAGDPCGAHDACGRGLCHVGRCTGSGAPVVAAGAARESAQPTEARALDDDGDTEQARFASTRGVTRVYLAFEVERRAGDRAYLVLEPIAAAPAWDASFTLDVHPIEEPWTAAGSEPRIGTRTLSVTFEAGPARRVVVDVSSVRSRHGLALRVSAGDGVGARFDVRATRLDVYR